MAEATTPSSTSSTPASSPQGKQYIKASTDDSALEPDALRGSEHLIKAANVQDDESDRRKQISPEEKK